jgi:tRNA(Ile)-lysidine synthase
VTATPAAAGLLSCAAAAFAPDRPERVGVAVSGGGDSVALLHLLHHAGWRPDVVTVDHGLRPAAAEEARQVAALSAVLGLRHTTLRWEGAAHGPGNLMDRARRARIALIADWARDRGISHVALGHTADDQAESFLMNLGRGAGLDGLSGMRPAWNEAGVRWVRPLLAVPRAALRDWLMAQGIGWIDDPTNEDDRFARIRARRALKTLRPLGITPDRLGETIAHLAAARAALAQAAGQAAGRIATEAAGALWVDPAGLAALPRETRRRLLIAAIRWMTGAAYPPREAQIVTLETALAEGRDATLSGCRFRHRGARLLIAREARAVAGPVPAGTLWDGRWRVTGPFAPGDRIAALGADGLRLCPDWRATGHPRDALLVSPALWREQRLIAAPLAAKGDAWQAEPADGFANFVFSH